MIESSRTNVHATAPRSRLAIEIGLLLLVLGVYWGSWTHAFVDFDDGEYVYDNPHVKAGLTRAGVRWAFTTFHAANWHPLTWLSHMLDVQLFGMNAGGHHAVNVAIHALNTLFVFWLFRQLTGAAARSAFAAALFGIHPLHVESVAWVAERKDVLSTLFMLFTLVAYAAYIRRRAAWRYAAALLLFGLGLMAKSMLVTLPFVLLLLDFWPLGRFGRPGGSGALPPLPRFGGLIVEKVPFLALAVLASVATYAAQSHSGATAAVASFPLDQRIANTFVAGALYLKRTVWPAGLAVFYPHPATLGERVSAASWIGAAAILALLTVLAARERRRRPYLLFGWLWFLGTLVPVIGIVQVGSQAMADRYTYVPLIGIFVAISWWAAELVDRFRLPRLATAVMWAGCLAPLAVAAHLQNGHWVDGVHLYRHAIAVTRKNWVAWNNLGMQFLFAADNESAAAAFHEAVSIKPDYSVGWYNLGVASGREGQHPAAADCYRKALELDPGNADGWVNLSIEDQSLGDFDAAVRASEAALKIRAEDPLALGALVTAYWNGGDAVRARAAFERLRTADPAAARLLEERLRAANN